MMDLSDTWVRWNLQTAALKRKRARRPAEPDVEPCAVCDRPVFLDDDFDVYSNALEVLQKEADDNTADGVPAWVFRDGSRLDDSRIVCLGCLRPRLPALAQWVDDFRNLRSTREALIAAAH